MRKLFPMQPKPTTWHNYSTYLNRVYEKIENWSEYLAFFNPEYQILNESLYTTNILKNNENEMTGVAVANPAWVYKISHTETVDGKTTTTYTTNYCFFPSELKFRQGYLNTYYKAYLCYFAPPNAFVPYDSREVEVSEEEWNKLVEDGLIQDFPPSRLILSKAWPHKGSHFSGNSDLLKPEQYLIISKPSASWYLPFFFNKGVKFEYIKNALEDGGSLVSFTFEFSPSRYILAERTKQEGSEIVPENEAVWGASNIGWSRDAASWDSIESTDEKAFIHTIDRQLWANSYPIMHTLQLRTNINLSSDKQQIHYDCEEVITDDVFWSQRVNSNNHSTANYFIMTSGEQKEMSDMWDSVYVSIC